MPPDPRDHHRRRRSSTHSRPPSIPSQDVPRQSIEDAYEPERHGDSGDESDGTQATEIDNRPVHERLGHHSDRARELAEWQHAHRNSIARNERGVTVPPHLRGESEEQQRRSESRLGTPYHLFNREETVDGPEPAGNSAFHAASRHHTETPGPSVHSSRGGPTPQRRSGASSSQSPTASEIEEDRRRRQRGTETRTPAPRYDPRDSRSR